MSDIIAVVCLLAFVLVWALLDWAKTTYQTPALNQMWRHKRDKTSTVVIKARSRQFGLWACATNGWLDPAVPVFLTTEALRENWVRIK